MNQRIYPVSLFLMLILLVNSFISSIPSSTSTERASQITNGTMILSNYSVGNPQITITFKITIRGGSYQCINFRNATAKSGRSYFNISAAFTDSDKKNSLSDFQVYFPSLDKCFGGNGISAFAFSSTGSCDSYNITKGIANSSTTCNLWSKAPLLLSVSGLNEICVGNSVGVIGQFSTSSSRTYTGQVSISGASTSTPASSSLPTDVTKCLLLPSNSTDTPTGMFVPLELPTGIMNPFISNPSPATAPTSSPTIISSATLVPSSNFPSITSTTSPPTNNPTNSPTTFPPTTRSPTSASPTSSPVFSPTIVPTRNPSIEPTIPPTSVPTTLCPTMVPSSDLPSFYPSTTRTFSPTTTPTLSPTSLLPTTNPTCFPTVYPTLSPTLALPTISPTSLTSILPSRTPSMEPTGQPTSLPSTLSPSLQPFSIPSLHPSEIPSLNPSFNPSTTSSSTPSSVPTIIPTTAPSNALSYYPSVVPSSVPSYNPTIDPTITPSSDPSYNPTINPTITPSSDPSYNPTIDPTITPSRLSSYNPTISPTIFPSVVPSYNPSIDPTITPSRVPSYDPTINPTITPSVVPSYNPTINTTITPSSDPTYNPTIDPTITPSSVPSYDQIIVYSSLSIEEYDESLIKLKLAIYDEEQESENYYFSFSQWAQLGVLYFERENIWTQGGLIESLSCFHTAADQYINKLQTLQSSPLTVGISSSRSMIDEKKLKRQYYAVLFQKSLVLYHLKLYGVSLSVINTLLEIVNSDTDDSVDAVVDSIEYSQILQLKGNIYDALGEYEFSSKFYFNAFDLNICNFMAIYSYSKSLSHSIIDQSTLDANATFVISLLEESLKHIKVNSNYTVILTRQHNNKEIKCIYNNTNPLLSEISPLGNVDDSNYRSIKTKISDANIYMKSIVSLLYRSLHLLSKITGHYSRSWQFLQMANNIHKEMLNLSSLNENHAIVPISRFNGINLELHANQTKYIKSKFVNGYWPPNHLKVGLPSKRPVFIVGFYRSGEDILKSLLSNMDTIFLLPDGFSPLADIIPKIEKEENKIILNSKNNKDSTSNSNVKHRQIINKMANGILESIKKSSNITNSTDNIYYLYKSLDNVMIRDQSFNASSFQIAANRVIDFELSNYRNIGHIHLLFPNAIIFNLVRDPMDTLFDCMSLGLDDKNDDYIIDPKILTYEYILYLNTMNHFRKHLPRKRSKQSDIFYDIRYDELILNPQNVIDFMLEKMNLSAEIADTVFQYKVERDLNHSIKSLGKWIKYTAQLNNSVIKEFRNHLPLLVSNTIIPYYSEMGLIKEKSDRTGRINVPLNWNMSKDYDYNYIVKVFKLRDIRIKSNQYNLRSRNITSNYRNVLDSINSSFVNRFNKDFLLSRKSFEDLLSDQLSKPLAITKNSLVDNIEFQKRIQDIDSILLNSNHSNIGSSTCNYAAVIMRLLRGRLKSALGHSEDAIIDFQEAESLMESINEYYNLYNDKVDEQSVGKHKFCSKQVNSFSFNLIKSLKAETLMNLGRKGMVQAIEYFRQLIQESFLPLQSLYNIAIAMKELDINSEEDWYDIYQKLTMIIMNLNFNKDRNVDPKVYDDMVVSMTLCEFENVKRNIHVFNDSLLEDMSATFWTLHITASKLKEDETAWNCLRTAHVIDSHRFLQSDEMVQRYSIEASLNYNKYVLETFQKDFWTKNSLSDKESQVCSKESKYTCAKKKKLLYNEEEFTYHSPIFIIGFYRSGSTLLETMLDAHPMIWGMGEESVFASHVVDFDKEFSGIGNLKNVTDAQRMQDELIIKYRSKILQEINARKASANETSAVQVIDKMLNNYRNIGLIHLLFPQSMFLHVVRDPLDTLVSCYTKRFGIPYLSYLTSDHKVLVTEYVNYLKLIQHFRDNLPNATSVIIDVRYESIVANPRRELQRIFGLFRNITWDETVMTFFASKRVVHTASRLQVNKPIYLSSVGHWKRFQKSLSDTFIYELNSHLPSLLSTNCLPYYNNKDFDDNVSNMNWDFDVTFNYTRMIQLLS